MGLSYRAIHTHIAHTCDSILSSPFSMHSISIAPGVSNLFFIDFVPLLLTFCWLKTPKMTKLLTVSQTVTQYLSSAWLKLLERLQNPCGTHSGENARVYRIVIVILTSGPITIKCISNKSWLDPRKGPTSKQNKNLVWQICSSIWHILYHWWSHRLSQEVMHRRK